MVAQRLPGTATLTGSVRGVVPPSCGPLTELSRAVWIVLGDDLGHNFVKPLDETVTVPRSVFRVERHVRERN